MAATPGNAARRPATGSGLQADSSAPCNVRQNFAVIGRWHGLVIDCPDPSALATFYQELLGMQRVQDDPGWVVIGDAADRPGVAFQYAPDHVPPEWPSRGRQQMHFDVRVDDLDRAEADAIRLGAKRLDGAGKNFRVFADPAGHPFCLVCF
jgi:catechol 2,3-dioxygenase-like lactoylglutathione lyase family enzyme